MEIFRLVLLLVHTFVVCRVASGAAVTRHESNRQQQQHTSVINLLDTSKDRKVEEHRLGLTATTVGNWEGDEYLDDYEDYEEEESVSGDYEMDMPRVAMSSKPNNPSSILEAESPELKPRREKGRKKGRGRGKKRDPCLKKYKDFCIHGTCQYHRNLRAPSCVCQPNYSGERCQFVTLPIRKTGGYSRTTALAVVAVVLSSLCLLIIGLLLMLRFHKRGAYDLESEEKVKLGLASSH